MIVASLLVALAVGQSDPYVRSRVVAGSTSAQCLYWTVPTITWQLSSVGNPNTALESQKQLEFAAIRRSFQSWQKIFDACGNLSFSEGALVDDRKVGYEVKGDNRNIVLFRAKRCADVAPSSDACWTDDTCGNTYDCWDSDARTIALTLTTYDEKSGIIYDSDIQLNASGFVFTTVDSPPCTTTSGSANNCVATDVQNTMTHEIGHLIGLDHTLAPGSVMYPRAPPGELSKRNIDDGSRDFVCLAYPKGQPSQSCITPTLSTTGNSAVLGQQATGCSSSGAGTGLLAMAGWALLAWRRRRGGARS
ncbi:myxosortase-dependent metalloprotease, MXAN_2677/MXAN_2678 family [Vitiosangium sp. GDMCC 1.1324]|uniref:myxosortase-dependent metalloprotease, MXAN_2677/MXAN_2678 family n=1 Tax=Vitiosangium sp. (strain GDMCC 1.1324) TaxID=2138576 RepID=UPI000D3C1EB5|nr:myxosortase-dependent metalloprotease, MXAN_2677/MXAN_2678 family [Vitiosangium sp. GDMCC 1.1324]PTL77399.1 matrixin [Vitiosangium sp. GDMCC 1.1324]